MAGLILEGVTGAGKTTVLEGLLAHPKLDGLLAGGPLLKEAQTFGELMAALRDRSKTDIDRCGRLRRIVQKLAALAGEIGGPPGFLFERFHPSYYALMPNWRLYAYMDEALARLGGKLVVLIYPEDQFRRRVLAHSGGEGLVEWYRGESEALEALKRSQDRRLELLSKTKLPALVVDTADERFEDAVRRVADFWGA